MSPRASRALDRLLLASGFAAATVYIGLDLFAASLAPRYSLRDQAISELSATGAPTAELWTWVAPLFGIFLVAFAIGLWRTSTGRAMRVTAALMLALAALGPLWALFPMHQRGTMTNAQDVGHLVLAGLSVALITSFMISGTVGMGGWFGVVSIPVTGIVFLTFIWTFTFPGRVAANGATPWMGAIERVAIYGYLLWIAELALLLFRRVSGQSPPYAPAR
jgi:hypothetical protein